MLAILATQMNVITEVGGAKEICIRECDLFNAIVTNLKVLEIKVGEEPYEFIL